MAISVATVIPLLLNTLRAHIFEAGRVYCVFREQNDKEIEYLSVEIVAKELKAY